MSGWNWDPDRTPEERTQEARAIRNAFDFAFGRWDLDRLDAIDPDECLIHPAAQGSRKARCNRPDHPTPTSDCTTGRPIRHVTTEDQ